MIILSKLQVSLTELHITGVVFVISTLITAIWINVALLTPLSLGQGIIFPIALVLYFFYRATQTFKVWVLNNNISNEVELK